MAKQEFVADQNAIYVPQATADMSSAQVDDIEHRAKAQAVQIEEKFAKVDSAEKGAADNAEAKLFGDILMEGAGIKLASTVIDFLDTRLSDKTNDLNSSSPSSEPRTIEDEIKATNGSFLEPKKQEGLFSRANIAASSLNDQNKDALKTWDVPEKQDFSSVKLAKEITYEMSNANDLALQSTQAVRQQHSATMYKINQISPGMGMGSGPSIRPQDLLREAEQVAAEQGA